MKVSKREGAVERGKDKKRVTRREAKVFVRAAQNALLLQKTGVRGLRNFLPTFSLLILSFATFENINFVSIAVLCYSYLFVFFAKGLNIYLNRTHDFCQ